MSSEDDPTLEEDHKYWQVLTRREVSDLERHGAYDDYRVRMYKDIRVFKNEFPIPYLRKEMLEELEQDNEALDVVSNFFQNSRAVEKMFGPIFKRPIRNLQLDHNTLDSIIKNTLTKLSGYYEGVDKGFKESGRTRYYYNFDLATFEKTMQARVSLATKYAEYRLGFASTKEDVRNAAAEVSKILGLGRKNGRDMVHKVAYFVDAAIEEIIGKSRGREL